MRIDAKLQLKPGERVTIIGAPAAVRIDLPPDARLEAAPDRAEAVIVFVTNRDELDARIAPAIDAARADRLCWVAYPKAGQLGTDLNRDELARLVAQHGVRPVRQIAIDDVWSALRFRPAAPA